MVTRSRWRWPASLPCGTTARDDRRTSCLNDRTTPEASPPRSSEGGRTELAVTGQIIGIHGLTMRRTRQQIVRGDRRHDISCAFDSIGIPAAMDP